MIFSKSDARHSHHHHESRSRYHHIESYRCTHAQGQVRDATAPSGRQACRDLVASIQPSRRFGVASGSPPPGAPPDFCARLSTEVQCNGVKLVLDTSGPALAAAL